MRRSELREHIFRMVFGLDFNEGEEIPEQIQLYFEQLDDVNERDRSTSVRKQNILPRREKRLMRCSIHIRKAGRQVV